MAMKTRIYLLIALLGVLFLNNAYSQESSYVFRHIGVTEGLPDNYVKSVFSLPTGGSVSVAQYCLVCMMVQTMPTTLLPLGKNIPFHIIILSLNNTLMPISVYG